MDGWLLLIKFFFFFFFPTSLPYRVEKKRNDKELTFNPICLKTPNSSNLIAGSAVVCITL